MFETVISKIQDVKVEKFRVFQKFQIFQKIQMLFWNFHLSYFNETRICLKFHQI